MFNMSCCVARCSYMACSTDVPKFRVLNDLVCRMALV